MLYFVKANTFFIQFDKVAALASLWFNPLKCKQTSLNFYKQINTFMYIFFETFSFLFDFLRTENVIFCVLELLKILIRIQSSYIY